MKPIRIDHANVFDDFKDVLVNIELTKKDKEVIEIYDRLECNGEPYDIEDVSMIVWVNVKNEMATGINYVAYYPAEYGECPYPIEMLDNTFIDECIKYVNDNYFGNEEMYDC